MTTITTADLHIVVAALDGPGTEGFVGYTAITAPLPYEKALEVWESKQRYKVGIHPRGRTKSYVREYAVRSMADPRFAPLVGQGYADSRNRKGLLGRHRGDEKAAMAWAELHGYAGRKGGWIYDTLGNPITQGWASFARHLYRQGAISQGSDGRWYVIDRELVA